LAATLLAKGFLLVLPRCWLLAVGVGFFHIGAEVLAVGVGLFAMSGLVGSRELKKRQAEELRQIDQDRVRLDREEEALLAGLEQERRLLAALQQPNRKEDARRVQLSDSADEKGQLSRALRTEEAGAARLAQSAALVRLNDVLPAERELAAAKAQSASRDREAGRCQAKLGRSLAAVEALKQSVATLEADVRRVAASSAAIAMQLRHADAENDLSAAKVDANARLLLEFERRVVAERLVIAGAQARAHRASLSNMERAHDVRKANAAVGRLEAELRAVVRRRDGVRALLGQSEATVPHLTATAKLSRWGGSRPFE
jgi:hypothetical protein